jgi:predicted AlkP superfamily phosphohydrolase/phosphomutase
MPMETPMPSERLRAIVIGLDGATFDLILPRVKEGYLPTFKRLLEEGSWGELKSTLPPLTGPAWSSFMTGKNPGKHGVFDFMVRNPAGYDWITINATYRKARSFWSFLEEEGRRAVIFNVPVTYPPEQMKGAMISGFLTPPGAKDFIFPPELGQKLEKEVGAFRPHYPGEIYGLGREEKFVQEILRMTEGTIRTIRFLMKNEPWDIFVGVIQSPDLLQHCLWKFEDPKHPEYTENRRVAGAFLRNYQLIDRYLGEVLEGLDGRTLLFIMSDHGFNCMEKQFFVNNWLLKEGFLVLKKNTRTFIKEALFKAGIVPMKMHKISASLGIDLSKRLAENREKLFSGLNQWVLSFEDVDWKTTRAYGMGNMGFININLKGREPEGMVEPGREYDAVIQEISERLSLLKDPQTGAPLVSRVYTNKEICWGPWASEGPDLFLVMKEHAYHPRGDYVFVSNHVVDDLWLISGAHRDHGIFLSWGPGIRRGYKVAGANIMDVAPTLLGFLGSRIPVDMDGRCLSEILTEETSQRLSLRYRDDISEASKGASLSDEEQEDLRKQLKGLGYLT